MDAIEPAYDLEAELEAERARAALHGAEAARHRGVAWSGFAPAPRAPPSPEMLLRRARQARDARSAWSDGAAGQFVKAMIESQAAAVLVHQACERARAAWSRDFADEAQLCAAMALEAEKQALRLLRHARRARRLTLVRPAPRRHDRAGVASCAPPPDAHE
jgi:hypothetical protein